MPIHKDSDMILAHICFEVLPENRELFIRTANDVTCLLYTSDAADE